MLIEFDKQDCELKAAYRLLDKIKIRFPRLPIIIGGVALYLGRPFLELCNKHHFEYIIRYKETDAPSIKRNLDEIKIINGNYEYQNEVIFGELTNKDFYTLNVISFDEQITDEKIGITTTINFSYVTSLPINSKNKEDIVSLR